MSKAKPTEVRTEDKAELIQELRANAMRKWAQHVTEAREVMRREVERCAGKGRWKDVTAVEVMGGRHEMMAMDAVWWLGAMWALLERREAHTARLERIAKHIPGMSGDDKVDLALAIVEEHAERYRTASGAERPGIVKGMLLNLWGGVDPEFRSLVVRAGEVIALLDRYKTGRKGRLAAAGIVTELNLLCGAPLSEHGLTTQAVAQAKARKRKASPAT